MAKKTQTNKVKALWNQLRFKYKLSFFNEATFEEVWSLRVSGMYAIVSLLLYALLLIIITSMIIIMTPIRNYLPGYLDVEIRKEIVQNALRADSLERMIQIQSIYLENLTGIMMGTTPVDSIRELDSLAMIQADYDIPRGLNEESFVNSFEEEEKYNLSVLNVNPVPVDGIFFYKPVSGIVSAKFEAETKHYGIDIVTSPGESIMATLDGTVIFAGFDPRFGNVIQLQHRNGFLSSYMHNELLLKSIGDQVIAGEAIAIVGNTGELSTGPHLHFELWYRGVPVNPEDYIAF